MFNHKHYVPLLKGREEGYRSLFEIDAALRSRLTPLIEVPSIPWDFVKDEQAKPTTAYLENVAENIQLCWDAKRLMFLDLLLLGDAQPADDGRHPVRYVFDEIRARKLNVIPVTGLNRDVAYQEAVADAEDQDRRGICLRITTEDFEESDNIEGELSELLAKLQVTASETDLILDLGEIPATRTTFVVLATKSILRGLPFVMDWRTLTLAASAFPPSLSRLASAEVTTAQRGEWIVWEALSKTRTTVPRLPTFGDYAVSHAEFMEMDLAIERAHIDLRYTTDRSWLILKGRDVKRHGNHQFNDLCKILVSRSEYSGPTFSWGDAYVQACAANAASAVDAATWRMVGTTHHLAFVTGQLAGLRV